MQFRELLHIADAIIDSVEDRELTDQVVWKLQSVLPEAVLTGALDILDRENVFKYTMPYTYPQYEVIGSKETYTVFLGMSKSPMPFYCSCPAFAYNVLSAGTHIMCKHILATRLADKLSLCVERPMTPEDLQAMLLRQFRINTDQPQQRTSGVQ